MLKTINSYIESPTGDPPYPASLGAGFIQDRRFLKLLVTSVVAHIIFYAVLVNLDIWVKRHWDIEKRQPELVKVTDIAPPPDRLPEIRRAPDPIDRADTSRFQFDPERGDDVNLVSRSPKPTTARGDGLKLPSSNRDEGRPDSRTDQGKKGDGGQLQSPPVTQHVAVVGIPKPDASLVLQSPVLQPAPAPQAPAPKSNSAGPAANGQGGVQGSTRGDGIDSTVMGLEEVQAQYRAYVRAKIRVANEKTMPKTWIAEVLSKKVSADFEVRLARGGRLLSVRKVRSTGYPRLDDVANDAIYIASPFEGFPRDAGDTITLIVTVEYIPWR